MEIVHGAVHSPQSRFYTQPTVDADEDQTHHQYIIEVPLQLIALNYLLETCFFNGVGDGYTVSLQSRISFQPIGLLH